MIDAARRAKVSSAAPYRHFEDKDALLQAVSEVAFLALDDAPARHQSSRPMAAAPA